MSTNSNLAVINPVTGKAWTAAEMQARIAELESQLSQKNNREIYFRVAEESGAVSAYGVQNTRPVTLYSQQWERLISAAIGSELPKDSPLAVFLAKSATYLSLKDDSETDAAAKKVKRMAESQGLVKHPTNVAAAGK